MKLSRNWLILKRREIEKAKGLILKMEKELGS
jgi:hypothetical protein